MILFKILKLLSKFLGVFPFEQRDIYRVSKSYLSVSTFVGFSYVIILGFLVKMCVIDTAEFFRSVPSRFEQIFSMGDVIVCFGRVLASLISVATKIFWRKEHLDNLNAISHVLQDRKLRSLLNVVTISDYFLIAALCVVLTIKITTTILISGSSYIFKTYICISAADFPMILDQIMLCAIFLTLSKYQKAVKQMVVDLAEDGEPPKISSIDINRITSQVPAGNFFQNRIHQIDVQRRAKPNSGRKVSVQAQKLERLRHMNLKIFNIYKNYLAISQYQLFLSIVTSILDVTLAILSVLLILMLRISFDFIPLGHLVVKILLVPLINLIKLFVICYYNGEAFNKGMDIKWTIQQVKQKSNEKNFNRVSEIFMEQLNATREFQICGLFAVNMELPITFLEHVAQYALLMVQYLDLKFLG